METILGLQCIGVYTLKCGVPWVSGWSIRFSTERINLQIVCVLLCQNLGKFCSLYVVKVYSVGYLTLNSGI